MTLKNKLKKYIKKYELDKYDYITPNDLLDIMIHHFKFNMELELGSWECKDSPTKRCVYDMNSDSRDDDCLICHLPDERK